MRRLSSAITLFAILVIAAKAADAPAYRPSAPTSPVPVIRTLPAGCTQLSYMVSMARLGSEGLGTPAFTTEASPLSVKYLGAQICQGGLGASVNERWVTCTNEGSDQASLIAQLAQRARFAAMCFPSWKADVHQTWAGITSPDGTMSLSLSIAQPEEGNKLDTTARARVNSNSTSVSKEKTDPCGFLAEVVTMTMNGRENLTSPPFTNQIKLLSKGRLGAPRCGAWFADGGATINCQVNSGDVGWAQRFMDERVGAIASCASKWRRLDITKRYISFTSLDGFVGIKVSMPDPEYGPTVETTAYHRPCDPLSEMEHLAHFGRLLSNEPVPTNTPSPLNMYYYAAEACSVRATSSGRGYTVACVFPQQTAKSHLENIVKTVQACHPNWKRANLSEGVSFESGDGLNFILEMRNGQAPGMMTSFAAAASTPAPTPTSTPAAPPALTFSRSPEQNSTCAPFDIVLAMARTGREVPGNPPFGALNQPTTVTPSLGAQMCKGWSNSKGGSSIMCRQTSSNSSWPEQFRAYRGGTFSLCYPGWTKQESGTSISYVSPDKTMRWTVSIPDARTFGPAIETSVHYTPKT